MNAQSIYRPNFIKLLVVITLFWLLAGHAKAQSVTNDTIESKNIDTSKDFIICCGTLDCSLDTLLTINFNKGSTKLDSLTTSSLYSLTNLIINNPNCQLKITGYKGSKKEQQLSWDRIMTIVTYLVCKAGMMESRLILDYTTGVNKDEIQLMPTKEFRTGDLNFRPPYPIYSKFNLKKFMLCN